MSFAQEESRTRRSDDGDSTPRFRFTGLQVDHLLVYPVPAEYLNKGVPLDVLTRENPDTQRLVEGHHDAGVPVTYGVVPSEMKQMLAAKPLVEGPTYSLSRSTLELKIRAHLWDNTSESKTAERWEFHGEGDEKNSKD